MNDDKYLSLETLAEQLNHNLTAIVHSDLLSLNIYYKSSHFGVIKPRKIRAEFTQPKELPKHRVFVSGYLIIELKTAEKLIEINKGFPHVPAEPVQALNAGLRISDRTLISGKANSESQAHYFYPEQSFAILPQNALVDLAQAIDYFKSTYGIILRAEEVNIERNAHTTPLLEVTDLVIKEFWMENSPQGPCKKDVVVSWMMENFAESHGLSNNIANSIDTITRPIEEKKKKSQANRSP